MNQTDQFRKRITELANRAYARDIVTFSDFLDLNQQTVLHGIRWSDSGVRLHTWGGYDYAERQMAAFVPDALSYGAEAVWSEAREVYACHENIPYPVSCLEITPVSMTFAQKLTHRDFLGSVLALGMDRKELGDLIVKDNRAILFCTERMSDYIQNELSMVRHTSVQVHRMTDTLSEVGPDIEERTGSVASVRLDAMIALAFGLSRTKANQLIREGAVYVNARLMTSNGHAPQEGDLISVRGNGKCRFAGVLGSTKKGRQMIKMERFI